ncbi:MAG: hypothetical protein AAGK09_07070 [Planctomycetota bacterium]
MAESTGEPRVPRSDRDWLTGYLAEHDALCPNCQYNLRGLTGAACPECGLDLALRVNLVEPRLAAWVAGLIGLAMSLGWSGLFTALLLVMPLFQQGSPPLQAYAYFIVGTAVSGVAVWVWLRQRSRLRRMDTWPRRLVAAACWLLPLINVSVFPALIS